MVDLLLSAIEESLEGFSVSSALVCRQKGNCSNAPTFAPERFQHTSGQPAFKQPLNENFKEDLKEKKNPSYQSRTVVML